MSQPAQWAPDPSIRPVQINHGTSVLPWFSVTPFSPEPDMKWEAEAMDAPLGPDVTGGLSDTEAKFEPLDPEVTDGPVESEMTDEPLDTHTPEATDTHVGLYIPAGVLGKFSSKPRYPDSEIALLEKHEWIRTRSLDDSDNVQVFVLPNAPQKKPLKRGKRGESENILLTHLKFVMSMIDGSPKAWSGLVDAHAGLLANTQPDNEEESLYYIYNTLQEPKPNLDKITDLHSWRAMDGLLKNSVLGLKTKLHPFQRESAAVMVQREVQPALALDPRFQPWRGPTGLEFYYDKVSGSILRDKILYPEACGGILAESMGCGKTLISLAVILATRGHFPKIPVEYQNLDNPVRTKTGTLMEMTAAAAGRFSLPWKGYFDRKRAEGKHHINCEKACVAQSGSYNIPAKSNHQRAKSNFAESAKHLRLCSGTLVIVPDNLMDHWEREIATHTSNLKVRVLQNKDETPSTGELFGYDIVLFSKGRCSKENARFSKNGLKLDAPIFNLHWLRVIVDEGHNLAGKTTGMVDLLKNLNFERRWMISGTPLSEMYGVELSIASQEADTDDSESSPDNNEAAILQKGKKAGNAVKHEIRNLGKLGDMVHDFFSLKPWANNNQEWPRYTKVMGEDGILRKSPSLRATLQSLVVRHRYETVKREITLPPLYNKVVYLEPTFYDRLYINIFLFTLAVNAITSEREGPDYMFGESDEKNKKNKNKAKLSELIQNLRLAGFWWAGDDNVQSTVDIALEYLEENQEKMTVDDFNQLKRGIQIARKAINSTGWNGFKKMHELGVFVRHFPEHARNMWALDPTEADHEPLLMGITQARRAQQFVMKHLTTPDPADGLAGEGIKVRRELVQHSQTGTFAHNSAPESANPPVSKSRSKGNRQNQTFKKNIFRTLPMTSPLAQTKLEGVASAKLRYLLDQVLKFQKTEKIIIFYEHDNVASWVEQGLEVIAVKFRTYAGTASMGSNFKTKYLREFRETEEVRVLLMSVKQASHGLHIPEASRMYIVNPIWERNVESQAIKRAHRIGQKRPVFVETLVLGDTLEYRMLNRSKNMTAEETKQAGDNPLNDSTMSDIIKNEPFLPMPDEASAGMAPLTHPLGLFDQHRLPISDKDVSARGRKPARKPQNPRRVSESNADSDSTGLMGPPAKRQRIGFAERDQIMGEGVVDAVLAPLQTAPGSNLASRAGVPVLGPSQTGFEDRETVIGDSVEAFGASGSMRFVPIRPWPGLPANGVATRPSLFGPFQP
ncbi:Helicase, C-terminal [Penicillium italicum]|uniref:Helicase, C-terminal n=1 Tax=Penicillium italicum TaxID=40296 RepID=A0A0A2LET0_PENIT|nr:Helicase, C-terminal [Penicillium italicum]